MDGYNPWKFFNDNRELLSSRQSKHCVTVRYEQRRFCGKLIQPPGFDGLQPPEILSYTSLEQDHFWPKISSQNPQVPIDADTLVACGAGFWNAMTVNRIGHWRMTQGKGLRPWVWGPPLASLGMSTVSQSWEAPVWKQTSWGLESGDSSWNSPDHKHFI